MALYAAMCGLLVGLRSMQAARARRHVPRGVITTADLALARARRWCSWRRWSGGGGVR